MTKNFFGMLVVAVLLATTGCAGTNFATVKKVDGYGKVAIAGRVGAFGTDVTAIKFIPEDGEAAPVKVTLKKTHKVSSTTWTGCKDKTPNKNAKNIKRVESYDEVSEDVLVYPSNTQSDFYATGNPSTGNLAMPAAAFATGMVGGAAVLRPATSNTRINSSGGAGGSAAGGAGGAGGTGNGAAAAAAVASSSSSD